MLIEVYVMIESEDILLNEATKKDIFTLVEKKAN
jgi:hypothetical protein